MTDFIHGPSTSLARTPSYAYIYLPSRLSSDLWTHIASDMWIDDDDGGVVQEPTPRIQIMLVLFLVSLFAVSFPTLSRRIPALRVPSILFFVGKHFGTGVILSTAFVHLLQDAFASLQSPIVRARWSVGNWTGLLVLASLLSIFFVEYISTSLVDRLFSYPSAPPSPRSADFPSLPPASLDSLDARLEATKQEDLSNHEYEHEHEHGSGVATVSMHSVPNGGMPVLEPASVPMSVPAQTTTTYQTIEVPPSVSVMSLASSSTPVLEPDERTPLRPRVAPLRRGTMEGQNQEQGQGQEARPSVRDSMLQSGARASASTTTAAGAEEDGGNKAVVFFTGGHHRYEGRATHASHTKGSWKGAWRAWVLGQPMGSSSESLAGSERARRERDGWRAWFVRRDGDDVRGGEGAGGSRGGQSQRGGQESRTLGDDLESGRTVRRGHIRSRSRSQQNAVGHAHGSGHAQGHSHDSHSESHSHGHVEGGHASHGHVRLDFEGDEWMGTPPNGEASSETIRFESAAEAKDIEVGRRRQVVGILMLQLGIMLHSLVIGLTLAITTGSEFTSLVVALIFHQLFEGLSLGVRIAGLPSSEDAGGIPHVLGRILKPALATAFAVATPIGIVIGLMAFSSSGRSSADAKLVLIQGLMSAMSAGMLIYAACIEMLAGDFVMDPVMWRSPLWRQGLALGSMLLGVGAMAALGAVG